MAVNKIQTLADIKSLATRSTNDVVSTLYNHLREYRSEIENKSYLLAELYKRNLVFDGVKAYTYTKYKAGNANTPYADVVIGDFNANLGSDIIQETAEANKEVNLKVKILNSALETFKISPTDPTGPLLQSVKSLSIQTDKTYEGDLWTSLDEVITSINTTGKKDVDNTSGTDSVSKMIYEKLLSLETLSDSHDGVGNTTTPGEIQTADGNKIKPASKFSSSDFIMIASPKYETNVTFSGNRATYNWGSKQLPLAGFYTLDLEKYEGVEGITFKTIVKDKFKAILIHKDLFDVLEEWVGTAIVNLPKLYRVATQFVKYGIYRIKTKPAFIFQDKTTRK